MQVLNDARSSSLNDVLQVCDVQYRGTVGDTGRRRVVVLRCDETADRDRLTVHSVSYCQRRTRLIRHLGNDLVSAFI